MRFAVAVLVVCVLATCSFAFQSEHKSGDAVLLRLTAEPMGDSRLEIPVAVRRLDKPGETKELIAVPGAVDATVLPPGVYEIASQAPVDLNGQMYEWRIQVPIFERITRVRLSIANAVAVDRPGRHDDGSEVAAQTPVYEPRSQATAQTRVSEAQSTAVAQTPVPQRQAEATAQTQGPERRSQAVTQTTAPQGPASVPSTVEATITIDDDLLTAPSTSPAKVELRRTDRHEAPLSASLQNGKAIVRVPPGTYEIVTVQPLLVRGHKYHWDIEVPLTQALNDIKLSEWQAVMLDTDEQPGKSPIDKPANTVASSNATSPAQTGFDEAEIRRLLSVWIQSLQSGDLKTHVACYAPKMDRYFLKTNVDQNEVRRDKERFLRRYPVLRKLEISDLKIQRAGDTAEATFRKTWDFEGSKPFRGQVASRLLLAKEDGRWVITMEREHYIRQNSDAAEHGVASASK